MRKRRVVLREAPLLPWAVAAELAGIGTPVRGNGPTRIYFARAVSGHIKIGCSDYPAWRIHKQTLLGDRAYLAVHGIDSSRLEFLLALKPGGFGYETALHHRFAAELATLAGPREWFKGPDIEAFVAAILQRAPAGAAA